MTSNGSHRSASAGPAAAQLASRIHLAVYESAYSPEAAAALEPLQEHLHELAPELVDAFYGELLNRPQAERLLKRLRQESFANLRAKQVAHLLRLTSPGLGAREHLEHALRVGHVHEMVGVALPLLAGAYQLYQQMFDAAVMRAALEPAVQERALRTLRQRLMVDLEAQIVCHYQADEDIAVAAAAIDAVLRDAEQPADLMRGVAHAAVSLDGVAACLLCRPDAAGNLQIEAQAGEAARGFVDAVHGDALTPVSTLAHAPGGRGPAGAAWRSGQIEIIDCLADDPRFAPWAPAASAAGFNSMASIPLLDELGEAFALLDLFSMWPGYFDLTPRRVFLRHVQQTLAHALLRRERSRVIPTATRHRYRQQVRKGEVRMLYQPIVNLRNGRVGHVEALARLLDADGTCIAPSEFLPAFGRGELLQLFRSGLKQIGDDLRVWRQSGLELEVAINLPGEGLVDDAYRDEIFGAIAAGNIEARSIRLELLETAELDDPRQRDARIAEFQHSGLRVVQDDLGSGHSSLLRLDRIPFDEVKLDQGLVGGARAKPQRTLEFVYHLTRLAHAVNVPVTVEGLEDAGLIEAATIMGADYGQGYGFARPMPTAAIPEWIVRFRLDCDPSCPRTALGALAAYLIWEQALLATAGEVDSAARQAIGLPARLRGYVAQAGDAARKLSDLLAQCVDSALEQPRGARHCDARARLIDALTAQDCTVP